MQFSIPLALAVLVSLGIIGIGCLYVASPDRIMGGFGLKPLALDADTRAWLRLKGIRDIVSGLVVLTLMLTTDTRTVGIALLVEAIIPFGDMSNVLASGGRKVTAFSVHGATCAVMIAAGLFLIHVLGDKRAPRGRMQQPTRGETSIMTNREALQVYQRYVDGWNMSDAEERSKNRFRGSGSAC